MKDTLAISSYYNSMSELHADVQLQKEGKSSTVLWDPFISGARRQAEITFSNMLGYNDCRLVNCGMAAIYSVLVAELRQCKKIITSPKTYFETEILFDDFIPPDVEIVRCDRFFDVPDTENCLLYFEPYINDPVSGSVISKRDDIRKLCEKYKTVIIDNSLFGPGLSLHEIAADNLIVIESGVKHYCEDFVFGAIFFNKNAEYLDKTIKTTGSALCSVLVSKLQQHLDGGDFTYRKRFLNDINFSTVKSHFFNVTVPSLDHCVAPVIYLVPQTQISVLLDLPLLVDLTVKNGYPDLVRAGFGWSKTCMRSYADDGLNQKNGLNYIRISLGCEGKEFLFRLLATVEDLCKKLYL
ncbi:PLP-dependent transferase [Erwinia mallotivora]|uniref:PLP-dependent transferase n=1 Tax=Erwinia mallotivora TaxID=69222 RepID=UPI0021C0D5DC|nr:PLP-dependent transferase [Erwinia mallotivora]